MPEADASVSAAPGLVDPRDDGVGGEVEEDGAVVVEVDTRRLHLAVLSVIAVTRGRRLGRSGESARARSSGPGGSDGAW